MSDHHAVPAGVCPVCNEKLNRAGGMDGRPEGPLAGDNCVCLYCTALLRFNADLTLRRMELHELTNMSAAERQTIAEIQKRIREFRRTN